MQTTSSQQGKIESALCLHNRQAHVPPIKAAKFGSWLVSPEPLAGETRYGSIARVSWGGPKLTFFPVPPQHPKRHSCGGGGGTPELGRFCGLAMSNSRIAFLGFRRIEYRLGYAAHLLRGPLRYS